MNGLAVPYHRADLELSAVIFGSLAHRITQNEMSEVHSIVINCVLVTLKETPLT